MPWGFNTLNSTAHHGYISLYIKTDILYVTLFFKNQTRCSLWQTLLFRTSICKLQFGIQWKSTPHYHRHSLIQCSYQSETSLICICWSLQNCQFSSYYLLSRTKQGSVQQHVLRNLFGPDIWISSLRCY